jgi:hypothetical protein
MAIFINYRVDDCAVVTYERALKNYRTIKARTRLYAHTGAENRVVYFRA